MTSVLSSYIDFIHFPFFTTSREIVDHQDLEWGLWRQTT